MKMNKKIEKLFPFNSKQKKMVTVIKKDENTFTAFVKGGGEIILAVCN